MSLGETIYRLRTQKNLSQNEVAEALDVSRQSISKWETDASVPELDKLIRISDLFGVSLDALVRGENSSPAAQEAVLGAAGQQTRAAAPASASQHNRVAAVILLCTAALVTLLCVLAGDLLVGVLLASPFLLCGFVCMFVRKHTGLWCAWCVIGFVYAYLYAATGVTWRLVRMTFIFTYEMNYARLVIAWVMVLLLLIMSAVTAHCFAKKTLTPSTGAWVLLGIGWVLLIVSFLPLMGKLMPVQILHTRVLYWITYFTADAARIALLNVLAVYTICLLRGAKQQEAEK